MRIEPVRGRPGVPGLGAILAAAATFIALAAAGLDAFGLPTPVCPFRTWTGWPCPGCGSTRMLVALARGEPLAALAWNPLAFLGFAALMVWGVASAVSLAVDIPRFRVLLDASERSALRAVAIGVGVAGWAYLIWHRT